MLQGYRACVRGNRTKKEKFITFVRQNKKKTHLNSIKVEIALNSPRFIAVA